MRVVILGSASSPHVLRWANSIYKTGIRVDLVTIHPLKGNINKGVNLIELNYPKPYGYILNIPKFRSLLKKLRPDIIHAFYALGYGTLATYSGFSKIILSVMGSDIYDDIHNPIIKSIVINNIKNAKIVCSTSQTMIKQIELVTGLSSNKIRYTPYGIDTKKFYPRGVEEKKDEGFLVFGTVKFLEHKYAIDVLIKAFALFIERNNHINSRLVIVGDGSEIGSLKNLSDELKVSHLCEFLGFLNHDSIPSILNSFDIYLALSRLDSESFGVAILEASSSEVPVIVSDKGGLPEIVENEVTGIVVESENLMSIVKAMELLANNEILRNQLGSAGRRRVEEHYSWDSSVNKMVELYNEL